MTQLTDNLFAVEVPSMAFGLMVNNYGNESELMYMLSMSDIADDDSSEETLITKKLSPGNWRMLCTTREATEVIARGIVGWLQIGDQLGYQDYRFEDPRFPYELATQSLSSLCKAKGLDGGKNYCLLKKSTE